MPTDVSAAAVCTVTMKLSPVMMKRGREMKTPKATEVTALGVVVLYGCIERPSPNRAADDHRIQRGMNEPARYT